MSDFRKKLPMFNITRSTLIMSIIGLLLSPLVLADLSSACSRILWNSNKQAVLVARSWDWSEPCGDRLVIYPRGMRMQGMPGMNPATWVSKYGSIGVVPYGLTQSILKRMRRSGDPAYQDGALVIGDVKGINGVTLVSGDAEGINEMGLVAHHLFLLSANYGAKDQQKPGVYADMLVRYILDNFATVKEAMVELKTIQIVCPRDGEYPLHWALEDPTGDSAIVEIIDGKMVIHHGREHTVMTNDPSYPAQLDNLKRYKSFGGTIGELPGGNEPDHHFVRAMELLRTPPEPKDQPEAIAYLFSVIRNVSVPYGAVYNSLPGSPTYPTWWTSVTDLTNRIFYFHMTHNPNVIWVRLNDVDIAAGRPMRVLDPGQTDLVGDVTNKFVPVSTGR